MEDKMKILEDIMELDEGTLSLDDKLSDYPEWDSLSILSFVVAVEERTGKVVSTEEAKSIVTVSDAVSYFI